MSSTYSLRRTCKTQAIVYSGLSRSGNPRKHSKLADQIPHLFFLLSSFTHSKTLLNPTAPRLSRLLELRYDSLCHLAGAKLLILGLERNRLRIPLRYSHELTFDVFHQLLAGIPIDQRASLALHPDPSHYDLLASSSCYRIPNRPDADRIGFDDLQAAFRSLSFKSKHIHSHYRLLSAILLLSNLHFEHGNSRDYQDQSATVSNLEVIYLLSVASPDLAWVLTNRI
ncbi:hypothetical protein PCANC_16920 [Puccinia coronata f. sp. avenae]|uniref:Myosin motor domain-containing protein n=1 Tax=Puccinia coronata f. sp. avenae TaxID=200324 RepID=A0A2N5SNR3_9BASI|nr:hypothetical protein PCANC_16920 [Puccinia coronata f. sp. avenae]